MTRLFSIAALLALPLFADNFVNPTDWSRPPVQMPKTPLPSIDPIYDGAAKPSANDANGATVIAEPRRDRPPTPIADDSVMTVTSTEFWIQVGAFSNSTNAYSAESRLKASGYNARTFSADLSRVAVGPYATRDQAERALSAIRAIASEAFLTTPERLVRN